MTPLAYLASKISSSLSDPQQPATPDFAGLLAAQSKSTDPGSSPADKPWSALLAAQDPMSKIYGDPSALVPQKPLAQVPNGVSVSSPSGFTSQGGLDSATNNQSATVLPTPPIGAGVSKVGDMTPEMQSLIASGKGMVDANMAYMNEARAQRATEQQRVQQMQNDMLSSPTPQLQKVQLNPLSALAAAATAGLMNNRFSNQGDQFVSNLMGGLAKNNQTDFENQQVAHQNKMQVLSSAVQALRDETMNNRFIDQGSIRANSQELGNILNNVRSLTNNQNTNQRDLAGYATQIAKTGITADIKQKAMDEIAHSGLLRNAYNAYDKAQSPAERIVAMQNIKEIDPTSFSGLTSVQMDQLLQMTPKEKEDYNKARTSEITNQYLPGTLLGKEDLNKANTQKALGTIQRMVHENNLDDQHAASLTQIMSNYDADHAPQRALNWAKEYQIRNQVGSAIHNADTKTYMEGLKNLTGVYNDQIKHATDQMSSIQKANPNILNDAGDPSNSNADAVAFRHLQAEAEGAKTNLQAIVPRLTDTTTPYTPFQKAAFNQMFAGYMGPASGGSSAPAAQTNSNPANAPKVSSINVPRGTNPVGPATFDLPKGALPGNPQIKPFVYAGNNDLNAIIPSLGESRASAIGKVNQLISAGRLDPDKGRQILLNQGITVR